MSRKKITREEFINRTKWMRYDMSNIDFIDIRTQITLNCEKHGEFKIIPANMLYKNEGCKECGIEKMKQSKSLTRQEFINKANRLYENFFDYSLTIYKNNKTKLKIICKKCGKILKVLPNNFLSGNFNHEC